jgi:hypothetical protein
MTHVNDLVSTEAAGRQPSPGFLLTPFGWAAEQLAAMVHAEPSLLPDLFAISRPRMHLIALALAHLDRQVPSGIGWLLARGPARQVLGRVLGACPAGIKRALDHLPGAVLQRQNYRRLLHLLADPGAAAVLHHADKIDDLAIEVLDDLPPPLRRPLPFALADWPRKLNGLTAGLQFLVSRGVAANVDELVAELATVTAWPQLAAMLGVLGRAVAATRNDAACDRWQRSAARPGRQGLLPRPGVAELPRHLRQRHRCGRMRRLFLEGRRNICRVSGPAAWSVNHRRDGAGQKERCMYQGYPCSAWKAIKDRW